MHHARKSKHRKMLRPKFGSSSSDEDDDIDDPTPMKWKPIIATFPLESQKSKRNRSIETNPIIDSLNAKMSQQQKLSSEVIQKEEIYNQAEMEANRKMFGSVNPGRCLSKDEIKRRKDIILQIVNARLKSKLSELMGEFGERIGMDDSYEIDRQGDESQHMSDDDGDDDSLPEAPPPPTFNTSSESSNESGDDLDVSFTKEFELYEKEIKEKTASNTQSNVVSTSIVQSTISTDFSLPSWQQPTTTQQWPMADVWIPPVGPPQVMDQMFPTPIEAEQMCFANPPPLFSAFANVNQQTKGWIDPSTAYANPPPTTFSSSFNAMPQPPIGDWIQPHRPAIPTPQMPSFTNQPPPRLNWNPPNPRQNATVVRPHSFQNFVEHSVYTTSSNENGSIVSTSTYVNAILAAEQKITQTVAAFSESKVNGAKSSDENRNESNRNVMDNNSSLRKRSHEQKIDKIETNCNSRGDDNSKVTDKPKKTRFDKPQPDQKQPDYRNDYRTKSLDQNEPSDGQTMRPLNARYEKINAETNKFLSNIRNTNTRNIQRPSSVVDNPMKDQTNVPIEWTKLCDIVDKLLDLSPNILNDLPSTDRRVKERNEILMILSDNPMNFYAHIDQYGKDNVKWAIKMAKRTLYPQGSYNDKIALAIAPFQREIYVDSDRCKLSSPINDERSTQKATATVTTSPMVMPKEWKKLCEVVDKLLDIPTRVIEQLSPSDHRVVERNEILMLLSNDPEDFLLHDDKYGARNVDHAILAAKQIIYPDGVLDERVQNIMLRQRESLTKGFTAAKSSADRSMSKEVESSRKRLNHLNAKRVDEHRSRSIPDEWNKLCGIVDKVLDTPKEVRIKMSKRDPRWEQRDNMLLVLSDDPDKLESQAVELGRVNVDWAIKSSKKVLFPNGTRDRSVFRKMSPLRKLLLRNRQAESINETKTIDRVNVTASSETNKKMKDQIPQSAKVQVNQTSSETTKQMKDQIAQSPSFNGNTSSSETTERLKDQIAHSTTKQNQIQQLPTSTSECAKLNRVTTPVDKVIDPNEVWLKLCNIVDKLLDLPPNAAAKLDPSDKRLIERNDILMILSDDPENFSKFDASYGNVNVAWAIKSAKKLIYTNGKRNEVIADALWKQRDVIMSAEESPKVDGKDVVSGECSEWKCVRKIATKAFLLSCKTTKLNKEQLHQQVELLLQLSSDPGIVRSKPIYKKIGDGRLEIAISKCKHILNRMRKFDEKVALQFEMLRSKMVLYSESLNQSKNIKNYNVILAEVRTIVDERLFHEIYGSNFNKWTTEQKLERNELAILLIKDPHFLPSSGKYLELVSRTVKKSTVVEDIVADVEKCLVKCEHVKEAPAVVCAPIVAKITDDRFMIPFKQKKLMQRIHRLIEQFLVNPKPEVFDVCAGAEGTIYVVCANAMTFDWLRKSINELDGLWHNAKLSISKAPRTQKVLDVDDLKEIKMMLKTVPVEPFAETMKQLKRSNAKLNTDQWQLIPSSSSDAKKMFVMVDLVSLVELERSKREVNVGTGTIYFDIQYVGKENF